MNNVRPRADEMPGHVGITKARFKQDTPNAKVNEIGTITKVMGLGRVEVTLEDGRTQRIDKHLLHILRADE